MHILTLFTFDLVEILLDKLNEKFLLPINNVVVEYYFLFGCLLEFKSIFLNVGNIVHEGAIRDSRKSIRRLGWRWVIVSLCTGFG